MAKDCHKTGNNNNNNNNDGGSGKGGDSSRFKRNYNHCDRERHMTHDCFQNPESSKYKGGDNKESSTGTVEVLVASIELEEQLGVEVLLGSTEQELENAQGKNKTDGGNG